MLIWRLCTSFAFFFVGQNSGCNVNRNSQNMAFTYESFDNTKSIAARYLIHGNLRQMLLQCYVYEYEGMIKLCIFSVFFSLYKWYRKTDPFTILHGLSQNLCWVQRTHSQIREISQISLFRSTANGNYLQISTNSNICEYENNFYSNVKNKVIPNEILC